jgi:DNA-binding winged helix-turn-helix (wHTH) protein
MDSAVSTAARALSVGDALTALKYVGLRSDPPALALRGIALAQLGELKKARSLLRRAGRGFGEAEPRARARCVVAEAEVALALRDFSGEKELEAAARLLARRGDIPNAALGRLIQVRRLIWLGRVEEAEAALAKLPLAGAPPRFVAIANLIGADIASKRASARAAEQALRRAQAAAAEARIPALTAEVERARLRLAAPVARLVHEQSTRLVRLGELEELFASNQLLLDVCQRELRQGRHVTSLVTRPLLLELLTALAEHAPGDVARDALIARVFGAKRSNESHRVRLRVEVGRLRRLIAKQAEIVATAQGFALVPHSGRQLSRLLPIDDAEASALWALLQGGEAWATSALAAALGKSQRAVQRALAELEAAGKVRGTGAGRARRWVAVSDSGLATALLLVAPGTLG